MKKYTMPLLVIILLSFVLRYLETLLVGDARVLITILRAGLLFYLGICLRTGNKRSQKWVGKVIISFIFALLMIYEIGYLPFPTVNSVFSFLGIYGYIIYLLYVMCGYYFFD